ncbi:amidase [Pseudolysinimonas yzui]|uniref:Amidase n=1 Tax=Pseudolysinimonas yzui TaxID=2708254 RepID=A0A8J3M2B1_9MICO|nr:amidase [Pseudolysinimonas yzui]GHF06913.1 amidase [Pseudolysinimonas yzui]
MFELHHLTAGEQLEWLRRGEVTPRELADHYLARIARLDAGLGAFVTVTVAEARARAAAVDELSHALPLWGLPFADKDLVARAGVPTRYGSRALADNVPTESDPLALTFDRAGAVSLGKTAAPEFGFPSYTEPVAGPIARNPYDLTSGAGGSSGGAAVAVAAGLLPFAPGSDGGGSVRIPAAATGLVGLKPSRGRVPAMPGFPSLAGLVVAGPLARTVADAALLLDALAGDGTAEWATVAPLWGEGPFLGAAVRGEGRFSVGVTRDSPWATAYDLELDPQAEEALQIAIRELDAVGHGVEELAFDPEPGYAAAFRTVWQAGAAGIPVENDRLALLEPLTRWLVETGRRLGARELGAALAWLTGFERRFIARARAVDVVLTPAMALTPRPLGWYDAEDGERNFAQQVLYTPYTSMVNASGLPAIVLPVHVTPDGLPMGVQLIGRPGREDVLLAIGAQLERRLHWERRHPPAWSE